MGSTFTQAELYGQVVLFSVWSIAMIVFLAQTFRTKAHSLQLAIALFLISFIFLCVLFGPLIAESDVPIGYRFESSIVVLLQRLGMVFLFAAVFPLDTRKLFKMLFYPVLGVYAILNITYLILDFIISSKALNAFKDSWRWRLSDRDAGLTNTLYSFNHLILNGNFVLNSFCVDARMFDIASDDGWQDWRTIQIKIGVAVNFLALTLAVFTAATAGLLLVRMKNKGYVSPPISMLECSANVLIRYGLW